MADLRAKYQSLADSAADQYGIPRDLFSAVITKESDWNPQAIGTSGEKGLGQIMPANVKHYGINPFDPKENLRTSAAILADNYTRHGNWEDALAAYNAGSNLEAGRGYAKDVLSKAGEVGSTFLDALKAGVGGEPEAEENKAESWIKKAMSGVGLWVLAGLLILLGIGRIINAGK